MDHSGILDTVRRTQLATELVTALQAGVPGSQALLRGSLAEGRADLYSDIDLLWDVPDAAFARAVTKLPVICAGVRPVASLRVDPDFQRSAKRRLVFIRFANVPLFWRVDLDIFARSAGRDPAYDRDNPAARGSEWSATESSLANAVAALKAHLRGRDDEAVRLLLLAEGRVGVTGPDIDVQDRILALVAAVAQIDPTMAPLAANIRRLVVVL